MDIPLREWNLMLGLCEPHPKLEEAISTPDLPLLTRILDFSPEDQESEDQELIHLLALNQAASIGSMEVIEFLLPRFIQRSIPWQNAIINPLAEAVENERIPVIKRLMEVGADPQAVSKICYRASNAMREAIMNRSLKVVQALIAAGADFTRPPPQGVLKRSYLGQACRRSSWEIVMAILDQGADINDKFAIQYSQDQRNYETPLTALCGRVNVEYEMVKLFVDLGAELNPPGVAKTPLIALCRNPIISRDILAFTFFYLKSEGADINHQDNDGNTPLQLAISGDIAVECRKGVLVPKYL